MRTFAIVWFGQLVSLIGSGLTGFALGVWVYQRTGSVTQYSLILLATALPNVALSPFAGALVDRWDRRMVMILGDTGAALSTLAIALMLSVDRLDVWHIYLATAVNSSFSTFQWLAYSAATTLLVPKQHLGRANGMVQLGLAAAQIASPALGGSLLALIQIQGVILIDLSTFIPALLTLLVVRIPNPESPVESAQKATVLREATTGWRYIAARPGLLGLLVYFAITYFASAMTESLGVPLMLSLTTPAVLGALLSIGGAGMLMGSLVMSVWGGPERRIHGVLGFGILGGLVILIAGLWTTVAVFAVAAFVFFFSLPISHGSRQAIWQSKVAPDVQGRAFAVQRMVSWSSRPLAYLVAGPLADRVFEPLMAADGPLVGSIGRVIGVGPGRGIGLLFALMGTLTILTSIGGYLYPRLWRVEDELPDAIAPVDADDS